MNSTILHSRRALIAAGILLALVLSACGAPFNDLLESQTLGSIGDRVWVDANMNGIQDPGEVDAEGVLVNLYSCPAQDGSEVFYEDATTIQIPTQNIGYVFGGLVTTLTENNDPPEEDPYGNTVSCYVVEVILPAGYVFSPQNQGTDDAADSDVDPNTGRTGNIVLTKAGANYTFDAGIYMPNTPTGNDGCTPGYWQNLRQHLDDWVLYTPDMLVSDVFVVGDFTDLGAKTLLDAVDARGKMTADQQLVRHAIAGLLNYTNPDIAYALPGGPAQLIADVNAALAGADRDAILALKDVLDAANNSGCPL